MMSLNGHADKWNKRRACRVIFVGYKGVGKTSVIARLMERNDIFQNVGRVRELLWEPSNYPLSLRCVDFGNELKHILYPCFFTPKTLYVVVCDAHNDYHQHRETIRYQEEAENWLHLLDKFAPGSPVIVLLNKADKAGQELMLDRLNKCNRAFRSMRNPKLFNVVAKEENLPSDKKEVPLFPEEKTTRDETWRKMRERILAEAYTLCDGKKDPALTQRGNVYSYRTKSFHKVKDLDLMAAGMNRLITEVRSQSLCANRELSPGFLMREDAEAILESDATRSYHDISPDFLLKLMEEREILFPDDNGRWLFPATLPDALSADVNRGIDDSFRKAYLKERLPPNDAKTLHYHCEVAPSLPSNIIVHLFNKKVGALDRTRIWKKGALFSQKDGSCQALVETQLNNSNSLDIWVTGKRDERAAYLQKLRDALMECLAPPESEKESVFSGATWSIRETIEFCCKPDKQREGADKREPIVCRADYLEAVRKASGNELLYVSEVNRMMNPKIILQTQKGQWFEYGLAFIREHSGDFDAFNQLCDTLTHLASLPSLFVMLLGAIMFFLYTFVSFLSP